MTPNPTEAPLQIWDMDISQINDVLRQIQDRIDVIKGVRGEEEVFGDKVFKNVSWKYKDSNGEVLHGFGNVI